MDKSWMTSSRTKKPYIDGVAAFLKYAVHNLQKMKNIDPRVNIRQLKMPCPCTGCLNKIEQKVDDVEYHLFCYGINLRYKIWDRHGEKDEQATTAQIPDMQKQSLLTTRISTWSHIQKFQQMAQQQ
jgi:hypothetical protein